MHLLRAVVVVVTSGIGNALLLYDRYSVGSIEIILVNMAEGRWLLGDIISNCFHTVEVGSDEKQNIVVGKGLA